jgi:Protein of unknown function (DUF4240)
MNQNDFWRLLDATRGQPERADVLAQGLTQLNEQDIVQFRIIYDDLINVANKVDLWAAAHLINGGCTEDEFYHFREGLLELGQKIFEAAVADPDSLVSVVKPGQKLMGSQGLESSAAMAWVAKTGAEFEEAFFEAVDAADASSTRDDADEGEWWNFNKREELEHRLPRLAEKFLKDEGR